jgi:hypothetical protein
MAGPRWIAGPARGGEVVAGKDADILAAREGGGGGVCVWRERGGRMSTRIGLAWLESSDASLPASRTEEYHSAGPRTGLKFRRCVSVCIVFGEHCSLVASPNATPKH